MLPRAGVCSRSCDPPGRVSDVSVGVGDTVHEGQVIARVEHPARPTIQTAQALLADARAHRDQRREFTIATRLLQSACARTAARGRRGCHRVETRSLGFLRDKIASQESS